MDWVFMNWVLYGLGYLRVIYGLGYLWTGLCMDWVLYRLGYLWTGFLWTGFLTASGFDSIYGLGSTVFYDWVKGEEASLGSKAAFMEHEIPG
jgi:hypothetical protein